MSTLFSKNLIIPTLYDQILEVVRLFLEGIRMSNNNKLIKRLERIILAFQLPGIITDDEKKTIETLIGNIQTETLFEKKMNNIYVFFKENVSFAIGFLSEFIIKDKEIPVYSTFKSVKLLDEKATSQAFLTREMHDLPVLFFIGIWMFNLIMQKVIEKHPEEYKSGSFVFEGKGGCFFAFSILAQYNVPLDLARILIQNAGRGDVDISILISPHVDNAQKLHESICDTIGEVMLQIIKMYGGENSILDDIIKLLVSMSSEITRKGYVLSRRKSFELSNKNPLFHKISDDEKNDKNIIYASVNKTLTFSRLKDVCSFHLYRICIPYSVQMNTCQNLDNTFHKSELLDISIQNITKDTQSLKGIFYEVIEKSIFSHDFLNPLVFEKILSYYHRLGYNIPNSLIETLKLLITLTL